MENLLIMVNIKPQKVLSLHKALTLKNPKLQGEFLITTKYEGWMVTIPFINGVWQSPISSNGNTIPSMVWCKELFTKLPKPKENCFLIAEAYLYDTPFEILNGIFNRSKGNFACKDVVFMLHDIVYYSNKLTAAERYKLLLSFAITDVSATFRVIPLLSTVSYNSELWKRLFELVANEGGEGIVAKRCSSLYLPGKRTSDLLKLKLECTVETLAVALEEGIGEQGFPSLTLISQRANGIKIRTVIGKHKDQDSFRMNPANVIGKVVQLKAMQEYPDGQLRQAVFQFIRYDKLPHEIN
jgi:ATP-dependent DNA ligase